MGILGTRVVRVEDPRLLTVGGTYTAELSDPRLAGAVHATYVRSTVAHARITSVDVAAARAMPGVVDLVTGADVDRPALPGMGNPAMARHHLARDRVRFVGEPVAVVLTERPEQGADAAEQVVADHDPLPAPVDPEAAVADGPDGDAVLFPEVGNLADYAFPSAAELPSFELVASETPTPVNPLGAKGVGESGTIGSTPAVHNAVCDAVAHLGVRHTDMPCTPERVWRAIQDAARH